MYLEVIAVHYNNYDGVIHACVLKACVSSKYSKCISAIKRILSTTAMCIYPRHLSCINLFHVTAMHVWSLAPCVWGWRPNTKQQVAERKTILVQSIWSDDAELCRHRFFKSVIPLNIHTGVYACGWCSHGAKGVLADSGSDSLMAGASVLEDIGKVNDQKPGSSRIIAGLREKGETISGSSDVFI